MNLRRLLAGHLRPYRRIIAVVVVLQALQTTATLSLPTLSARIIDEGVAEGDTRTIMRIGSIMLGLSLLQIVFAAGAVWFGSRAAMAFSRDVRRDLFHQVTAYSAREVGRFGAPSLITRLTNDVTQVQMLVGTGLTMLLAAPLTLIIGVILAIREDVGLSIVLAVGVPLMVVMMGSIIVRMIPAFQQMQVRIDQVNTVLREQITGIRVVRAFVREPEETARFTQANAGLTASSLRAGRLMASMFPTVGLLVNLSSLLAIWIGGDEIGRGELQVGSLVAYLSYLTQVLMAVVMATFMVSMIPRASVAGDRIMEVLDTPSSVRPPERPVRVVPEHGTVEFRDVSFRYAGAEHAVLDGITFRVEPGTTTAIIGSTGSGKTTLVNLVARLFDATEGSVLVNGVDVRELDPELLWGSIGYVPQKAFLFSGTVASNLRFGRPSATDEELWHALEVAQAAGFVQTMPAGLDSPITQGGTNVSGGQRQRLSIARALVAKPEIYVFDDSFSALDLATDARVRAALEPHTREAAVVIVAQRVSTIVEADQIVVLDDGEIVGRGTHDELLATCATYAEIVASQLGSGAVGVSTNGNDASANGQAHDDDHAVLTTTGRAARGQAFGPHGRAGMPTERSKDFGASVRRLGEILGNERGMLALVGLLTLASVTLVALGPRLLGQATDIIVDGVAGDGVDFGRLHRHLLMVGGIYLLSWVFGYSQSYLLAGVIQRAMFDLRESVERKINRLPLTYIDRQERGDLLSRVTNDIDNLSQSLQQTVSQIVTSLLTLVGVTVMMFVISPLLAVVALVTVPTSVMLMSRIGKRARPRFIAQWRSTGALNAQAEEVFTGHTIVKSFGRQVQVEAVFREENDRLFAASRSAQFTSGLIQPMMVFTGNVQYLLIAVVGGLRIASGAVSVGDVQAMMQYTRQFAMPLSHLASMAATFQSGVASLERVLELLDADEQSAEPAATIDPAPVRGRIVFDDVRFSYDSAKPLIEGLTVVAEPGQTIAIVGPTGAGKTTLVNLLMRFYELDGGRILLDGRDIATMPRDELRREMGMVLQDTWLFGGTIRENLRYGNPAATDAEVLEAARVTYVDRFVHSLPDGYDTVINDEGDNISAGEKQLITIARAFLSDPSILILDEATSSVDTRTEVLIQEAMNALRADRTSFVIAHRLSTIRGADVILVMDGGSIVEQGSHDELLALDGPYSRLFHAQFAGQAT